MSRDVFDKWNRQMGDGFAEEVDALDRGENSFEDVPVGDYEVKIDKMELKASKSKGDPMLSVWFKILEGSHKNSMIFMNQVIVKPFQIHLANEFLRSLDSGVDIRFQDYGQYNDLVMDVKEEVDKAKLEYHLEYGEDGQYKTFKIAEVFEN